MALTVQRPITWAPAEDYTELSAEAAVSEEMRAVLSLRLARLVAILANGKWQSVAEVAAAVGSPEPGISAQLRDLRKPKYGSHPVESRRDADGVFRYRLVRP